MKREAKRTIHTKSILFKDCLAGQSMTTLRNQKALGRME